MARFIKPDEIRPLIGNLSRPNYYQVNFGGLSPQLRGYLASRGVSNQFIAGDAGLLCNEASLPGSSLSQVQSTNFHGVLENFAHTKVFTPINLTFYSDDEYRALRFMEHWMEFIVSGNGTNSQFYASPSYNYRMKYPDDYKSNSCNIQKFETNMNRVLTYSFLGLYPANLTSTPVRYGVVNDVVRINCSFSYDRYIAGNIYSFDYLLGRGNNLSGILRDVVGGGADLVNRLLN